MPTTTPDVATTDNRTPTEKNRDRVAELEFDKLEIESDKAADPVKYADDLNAWHGRDTKRQQRLVEIEGELRERAEWGHLVDTAPEQLRAYVRVARAVRHRYEKVLRNFTYGTRDGRPGNAVAEANDWWRVLERLVRALDREDDHVRSVVARELDHFITFRNAVSVAEAKAKGTFDIPCPEIEDRASLPPWVRCGVTRTDKLADDA